MVVSSIRMIASDHSFSLRSPEDRAANGERVRGTRSKVRIGGNRPHKVKHDACIVVEVPVDADCVGHQARARVQAIFGRLQVGTLKIQPGTSRDQFPGAGAE